MKVRFKDTMGTSGTITDSLTVEYSGVWESRVREVVQKAKEETPEDNLYDPENPHTYLIMKLPEEAPITEVRRVDMC